MMSYDFDGQLPINIFICVFFGAYQKSKMANGHHLRKTFVYLFLLLFIYFRYLPIVTETQLDSSDVSFKVVKERKNIFQGMKFIFLNDKQVFNVWYTCFVDHCLSFCPFFFGHGVVCPSLIYRF